MTAAVFESPVPTTIAEKRAFLLANRIALWDVIASCEIRGSADNSIESVVPNDLSVIFDTAPIRRIFTNGKTAQNYYEKYLFPIWQIKAECLPSTSPANAAWDPERLIAAWQVLKD